MLQLSGRSSRPTALASAVLALALLGDSLLMGGPLLYVAAGITLLATLPGQSQQPPVFFSFFARVASFFSSGTSAKQAARQSSSLR